MARSIACSASSAVAYWVVMVLNSIPLANEYVMMVSERIISIRSNTARRISMRCLSATSLLDIPAV